MPEIICALLYGMAKIKHAQKLGGGGFGAWRRGLPAADGIPRWFWAGNEVVPQQREAMERLDILCRGVCCYESLPVLIHCFIICTEVHNIHWIKWVRLWQSSTDVSPAQCMKMIADHLLFKKKAKLWPGLHPHRKEERGTRTYLT